MFLIYLVFGCFFLKVIFIKNFLKEYIEKKIILYILMVLLELSNYKLIDNIYFYID